MKRDARTMSIALMVVLVLAGCRKTPVPVQATPPPAAAPAPTDDAERAAAERAAREAAEAAAAAARREADRVRSTLEARVFFAYDQAELDARARAVLDEKAGVLRAAPAIRLRIEGHADERGSTEYNLALASRRARAVATYLAGFGIPAERLETVSFGEERPFARGSDESAWAQNRRAEFVITAGAPTS